MDEGSLSTERLILRPPVQDDLPWLLEAINTPAVMRYLAGVRSPEAVADSLAEDIAAFDTPGGHRRWTVWLRDGPEQAGVQVGRVGLFHVRSPAAPPALQGQREIGWTFAPAHWGKGYATEAAQAVIAHAFDALALPVLYAQTSDSNAASTRMMQRLGFARRPELGYADPDYPPEDNPTTVWSIDASA
jgi:RimJ/RimL family protein N-acetyltransferase